MRAVFVWTAALLLGCAEGGGGGDTRRGGEDLPDRAVDAEVGDGGPDDLGPPVCRPEERSLAPCPQQGICSGSQATCNPAGRWGPCDLPPMYEPDEGTCDGLDNDCNGRVDEAWPGVGQPCDSDDEDLCALGQLRCAFDGSGAVCADDESVVEACNGADDDCDGVVDEPGPASPLAERQAGVCAGLRQQCDPEGIGYIEPNYLAVPGFEAFEASCDGRDNDCDGRVDAGLFPPLAVLQGGVCAGAEQVCNAGRGWQEPDYTLLPGYEAEESTCDGRDSDCDGAVDEALQPPQCPLNSGICASNRGLSACLGPAGFGPCQYGPDYEPDEVDTCDTLDNDCDGVVDEGEPCPVFRQVVRVEAGSFAMGSPEAEADRDADETLHRVEITHDLLVRRTEVTQDEWRRVLVGENPALHPGADRPVERISFSDALRFLNALSVAEGLSPCYADGAPAIWARDCDGWRLPTEAEWEYFARAGTTGSQWGEARGLRLQEVAWYRGNSGEVTHPVAQLAADAHGLFDTLGNVSEWVFDAYGPYPPGPDPVGLEGASRVARGGSYATLAARVRVANRIELEPASTNADVGLRPVRTAPGPR